MHLMLLAAGVLAVAAGVVGLLFGAANFSPGVGNTLILVGTVAVVGGAILVGMGAILSRLRRIHDTLESQMVPRAIVPDSGGGFPGSLAPSGGSRAEPALERTFPPAATGGEPTYPALSGGVGELERDEAATLPLSALASPAGPPSRAGAASPHSGGGPRGEWPRVEPPSELPTPVQSQTIVVRADGSVTTEIEPRDLHGAAARMQAAREGGAASIDPAASPAILKSGVVEGMAYTLYDDGSIEAEMPDGTIRFNSISELRAHLRDRAQSAG